MENVLFDWFLTNIPLFGFGVGLAWSTYLLATRVEAHRNKLVKVDERVTTGEKSIRILRRNVRKLDERVTALDHKIDILDLKLNVTNEKLDATNRKLDELISYLMPRKPLEIKS